METSNDPFDDSFNHKINNPCTYKKEYCRDKWINQYENLNIFCVVEKNTYSWVHDCQTTHPYSYHRRDNEYNSIESFFNIVLAHEPVFQNPIFQVKYVVALFKKMGVAGSFL